YSMRVIQDKPRNLDKGTVTVHAQEIETWEVSEVRKVYASLSGRVKLWFLLYLNCGMTGADMEQLRDGEVDFAGGIITRQRTKTSKHHSGSVPVVRYKL